MNYVGHLQSQTSRKSGRYFILHGADNFILNQAILKGFDQAVGHETLANSIQVKGTLTNPLV